jgi:hypothetical protein
LINAGADVNAKGEYSYNKTPLELAIESKETEIAELLKKHGAK